MFSYTMTCTHCGYAVMFRTEPDAKTEGVRHLRAFPTHGVKVTPTEAVLSQEAEREAERVTG